MKSEMNKLIKLLKNWKLIQIKFVFVIFTVAIIFFSGISIGLESLTMKKEMIDIAQVDESYSAEYKIDMINHPDITQNRNEYFIGNTGYEPYYYYVEDIINAANGNLYLSMTDISIKGRGFDIEIIRSYNSHNSNYSSIFGYGWTFNYNSYIIDYNEYVIWIDGDGSAHNFSSIGNGNYLAPPGIYSRLNKNIDNSFTLWMRDGIKYEFNPAGMLHRMVDRNGNCLTFNYEDSKLITIADDSGLSLNISYNSRNKISSIEDPLGRRIEFFYDLYDNLIRVIDAMGNATRYVYQNCHKLASVIDRVNTAITFDYYHDLPWVRDVRNSVYVESEQKHYNSFMVVFVVYDPVNYTTYFLNAENYAFAVKTNEHGNPILFVDSLNYTRYLDWIDNAIVNYTDANGNNYQYEIDSYGNLKKIIDPLGYETIDEWEIIDTSNTYLCLLRNVSKVIYEPRSYTEILNDTFNPINPIPGWVASTFWIQAPGSSHSPPESYGCGFGWYGQGWHETLQTPYFDLSNYTNVEFTFWHMKDFDGDPSVGYMPDGGNVKISTDGGQTWTLITPDGGYDGKLAFGQGNPMEVERAFGYSTYPTWMQERFDLSSYVGMASNVSIRFEMGTDMNPSGHQGWFIDDILITGYTTIPKNITTRYFYDNNGNLIQTKDALGNSTYYQYDSNDYGYVTNVTDFRGNLTYFEYDDHSNLESITDATINTTYIKYDIVGRLYNYTDANGHSKITVYDDNNRIIESVDATGNVTKYNYNAEGAMISIIDAKDHQTNYTNNVVGRVEKVQDPAGNYTYYKYSRKGVHLATTDANGNTSKTGYDPLGRPISVTDALGYTEWYGYDGAGNVIWVMDKNYAIMNYEYDKLNRIIRIIDPYFAEIVFKYDELGNLIDVTDQNGNHTDYEYDALNRLIRARGLQGCGCDERLYRYDANNNLVQYTDANNRNTIYEYDALNRLIKIIDPIGKTIRYSYDAVGNPVSFTDRNGYSTYYVYDQLNRLIKTTDATGNISLRSFDEIGNLKSVTNARGYTTTYQYDELNQLINEIDATGNSTRYKYDAIGNLIEIIDANNNSITFTYDELNRVTKITDPLKNSKEFLYDPVGNILLVTDANNNKIQMWYDQMNRVIQSGNPTLGNYYYYWYDKRGNIQSVTDPGGGVTWYTFDHLDRLTKVTYPLGSSTLYTYDAVGNLVSYTDPNGNTINYTYDVLDQLTLIEYPVGNTSFNYDPEGNMLYTVQNGVGLNESFSYDYDKLNRLINLTVDYGVFNKTLLYTYDEVSNVKTLTEPEMGVTTYEYDPLDRLIKLTDPNSEIFTFQYDNISRRTGVTYPNGISTVFSYNPANQLINITNIKSNLSILSQYNYTYDNVGNKMSMKDYTGAITRYAYDTAYRLTGVTYPSGTIVNYSYDGLGFRLSETINHSQTTWYTSDLESRLLTDGINTYTYDNNGNLIIKTDGFNQTTFNYDYDNKLLSLTLPDTTTINYRYSPFIERLYKNNGTTTTYYLYDNEDILMEFNETGAVTAEYVHGPDIDEPLIMRRNGGITYYHFDGIGSITSTTNDTENVMNTYNYDAFGNILEKNEVIENTYTFTSREREKESDLYYNRLRYYSPDIGRFLSKDPIINYGNRYIYASNNPINFDDPFGLQSTTITVTSRTLPEEYNEWWTKKLAPGGIYLAGAMDVTITETSAEYPGEPETITERQEGTKCYERTITRTPIYQDITTRNVHIQWSHTEEGLAKAQRLAVLGSHHNYYGRILHMDDLKKLMDIKNFLEDPTGTKEYYSVAKDMYDAAKEGLSTYRASRMGGAGSAMSAGRGLAAGAGPAIVTWAYQKFLEELGSYFKSRGDSELYQALLALRNSRVVQEIPMGSSTTKKLVRTDESNPSPWCQVPCSQPTTTVTTPERPSSKPQDPPVPTPSPPNTPITPSPSGGSTPDPSPTPSPSPPKPTGVVTTGGTGSSQGGIGNEPYHPLEPGEEPFPGIPVIPTDGWDPRLHIFTITPNGNGQDGGGVPPGTGGDLELPPPPQYCVYRMVYFGSNIVQDQGENHKVLYNAIKWAAGHSSATPTNVLLMPSWGGYNGWSLWQSFASKYTDINIEQWSDQQNERITITYSGLKVKSPDVLIDSDHYSDTQQGGYYTSNEIDAIQKYLLDEHGYIATFGTLGNNTGQSNQTEKLLSLLGLNKTEGNPNKYTNNNPWIIDAPGHPLFYNISMTNWLNAGDVTGNVDIGVCPLCGEKHYGSKLAHLRSTAGNHYSLISAYQLWYSPLSAGGIISQSGGECIVVPQTVYFSSRVVDDTGNNHDALYNAIKWAAEHDNSTETKVLIMPGWGGYEGWSLWQTFANKYSDINLSRWSSSSTTRNPVTTYGLEATEADVLIDSNHSSSTQQGGFYNYGELQAIEWYVKSRGHGYIVTYGSLGNHTLQTNQTDKLMELLSINNTALIGNYNNDRNWIIDKQYHPVIYGLPGWNPGNVTANLDVENADKIAHLYSTQGNHHTITSAYEGFGKGTCECLCNIPPVANFTWYPPFPSTTDLIQFTDHSEDIDGTIVNWTWDFDDGNISYLMNPTHQYTNPGNYNVSLTVIDNNDYSDSIFKHIYIYVQDLLSPEISNVHAIPPVQIENGYVNISAEVTDNTELDQVYLYIQQPDTTTENISITQNRTDDTYYCNKTYQQHGIYIYHIWANDTSGNQNISMDYNFEIVNNPPNTPSQPAGPISGYICISYNYSTSTTDPEGDDVKYGWDWDDGTPVEWSDWYNSGGTCTMSHSWDNPGTYEIKVKAMDIYGNESNWSLQLIVTMANHPPNTPNTPDPSNNSVNVSINANLCWSGGDPDTCDTVTYDVYFGESSTPPQVVNNITETCYDPGTLECNTIYYWMVVTWDNHEVLTVGPLWRFTTEEKPNSAPEKPDKPDGQIKGKIKVEYTYTSRTTDFDEDQVYYNWSWGDGSYSGWLGPNDSNITVSAKHTWTVKGTYQIKVKAKDTFNAESEWSDPLEISMPKTIGLRSLLLELLERFSNSFLILRHLFGL